MPSDAYENLIALLTAGGRPQPDMPLDQSRIGMDLLGSLAPPAEGVTVTEVNAGGVVADLHAAGGGAGPVVLYFHGGGYVIGSRASHAPLAGHLAVAIGGRVLLPDYRLAPEHPAPAALDDAVAAYQWLLDTGVTPRQLVVGGESAGGGLAAALLMRLRDEGRPLPACGALLSPWVDLTLSSLTMTTNAEEDLLLSRELLDHWAGMYAGELPRTDARLSPLFADWSGLPPLFVQVGTREILLDDAHELTGIAEAAGTSVELEVAEGMIHIWQIFAGLLPEADEALAHLVAFARPHLG